MAKKSKDIATRVNKYNVANKNENFLPTGFQLFDAYVAGKSSIEINIGNPKGKMIAISGPNGVGKSTLFMEITKRYCDQNIKGVWLDFEGGLNKNSIKSYGLDEYVALTYEDFLKGNRLLLVINPKTYNETADIMKLILENVNGIGFYVVDSLKAIQPTSVMEKPESLETMAIGLDARIENTFLPYMRHLTSEYDIVGLWVNQVRVKMTMHGGFIGEAGSNAFLHYMDIRMYMKQRETIKSSFINNLGVKDEKVIGNWVEIENKKSRFGNNGKIVIPLLFGKGVSLIYLYFTILSNSKYIVNQKAWNTINIPEIDIRDVKVQGENGKYKFIKDNFEVIEDFILKNDLLRIERISDDIFGEYEEVEDFAQRIENEIEESIGIDKENDGVLV